MGRKRRSGGSSPALSQQPLFRSSDQQSYQVGDRLLYFTRDDTWVPCSVVSVDNSIDPPSYGILVEGGSPIEAEAARLRSDPDRQGRAQEHLQQRLARGLSSQEKVDLAADAKRLYDLGKFYEAQQSFKALSGTAIAAKYETAALHARLRGDRRALTCWSGCVLCIFFAVLCFTPAHLSASSLIEDGSIWLTQHTLGACSREVSVTLTDKVVAVPGQDTINCAFKVTEESHFTWTGDEGAGGGPDAGYPELKTPRQEVTYRLEMGQVARPYGLASVAQEPVHFKKTAPLCREYERAHGKVKQAAGVMGTDQETESSVQDVLQAVTNREASRYDAVRASAAEYGEVLDYVQQRKIDQGQVPCVIVGKRDMALSRPISHDVAPINPIKHSHGQRSFHFDSNWVALIPLPAGAPSEELPRIAGNVWALILLQSGKTLAAGLALAVVATTSLLCAAEAVSTAWFGLWGYPAGANDARVPLFVYLWACLSSYSLPRLTFAELTNRTFLIVAMTVLWFLAREFIDSRVEALITRVYETILGLITLGLVLLVAKWMR